MESKLNGFMRLEEYANDLPRERPYEKESDAVLVNRGWVTDGRVEIKGLKMRYREGLDLVLKGVNCVIKGGEKCGVVGRTGSGKSSLMMALFRIVEASEGQILVDGEDIATIGLDLLRKR
jgi:ATP-binding cassette, subfamily C (CFTR/MRP), member 1